MKMLDEHTHEFLLMRSKYRSLYIDRLLSREFLDHDTKYELAFRVNYEQRWVLIKNHKLNYETMRKVWIWGTHEQYKYMHDVLKFKLVQF